MIRISLKTSPPRIPPAPSCGAETQIPSNFKNISLGFANPPSRKIVSQNRVHFVLVLYASLFSFGETVYHTGVRSTREALIHLIFAGKKFEQMLQ